MAMPSQAANELIWMPRVVRLGDRSRGTGGGARCHSIVVRSHRGRTPGLASWRRRRYTISNGHWAVDGGIDEDDRDIWNTPVFRSEAGHSLPYRHIRRDWSGTMIVPIWRVIGNGVLATLSMDVLTGVAIRLGLVAPLAPNLVGRWFASVARAHPVHADIAHATRVRHELLIALPIHYVIGIVLTTFFIWG